MRLLVTLVPKATSPRKALALYEFTQRTPSKLVAAAKLQRVHAVVHNDTDRLFLRMPALQLLNVETGGERYTPRC